jgi:hypothetical protein
MRRLSLRGAITVRTLESEPGRIQAQVRIVRARLARTMPEAL